MAKQNNYQRSAFQVMTSVLSGAWMPDAGTNDVKVVRAASGMPGRGKVFAAVHSTAVDIPLYAAGTCAKLIKEGWTGYLIRVSNDEQTGPGNLFKNILANESDHVTMSHTVGFAELFDLYNRDHCVVEESPIEVRGRLILLLRTLKVNALITCLPTGIDCENPDQWFTTGIASQAAWMAGIPSHYPEHADAGAVPHRVTERWFAVPPSMPCNRVVDIGSTMDTKIDAIVACRNMGGAKGSQLRQRLAGKGRRLPLLGDDNHTADRAYVREFTLAPSRTLGEQFGLGYAESFLYFNDAETEEEKLVNEYLKANAVRR